MADHWIFPLVIENLTNQVRLTSEEGAFGYERSYYYHTGVDLYVKARAPVYPVEPGVIVAYEEYFTDARTHPFWLSTSALLVEGESGVVCYGEITPWTFRIGDEVDPHRLIGHVSPVIPEGDERPDIPGHSRFMLHLELYERGVRESVSWHHGEEKPKGLLDPTDKLQVAWSLEQLKRWAHAPEDRWNECDVGFCENTVVRYSANGQFCEQH